MTIFNWDLASQPINWLTVMIMLLVAAIALHLVLSHYASLTGASA